MSAAATLAGAAPGGATPWHVNFHLRLSHFFHLSIGIWILKKDFKIIDFSFCGLHFLNGFNNRA